MDGKSLIIGFISFLIILIIHFMSKSNNTKLIKNLRGRKQLRVISSRSTIQDLFNEIQKEIVSHRVEVLLKHDQILICESRERKYEIRELVFLTLDANKPKEIQKKGAFFTVRYQNFPSTAELRQDIKTMIGKLL